MPDKSRAIWLPLIALSLLLAAFRCGDTAAPGAPPVVAPAKPRPRPDLRVMLLTDPRGYLEPCGCQQRPLGGVDKLAASVARARADGIPLLVLATGSLTFGTVVDGDDAESARTEELWHAQTLVDAWNAIGITAATPGVLDFARGLDVQRELAKRAKFPWLVANANSAGAPLDSVETARVFTVGDRKVGLFGLVEPNPTMDRSITFDPDLAGVAKQKVAALRSQGAEVVIAMVSGDRRAAREAASAGPDFVVMGGLDQEEPIAPSEHAGVALLHAGRQGQRVLTVDLSLAGKGTFHDASEWTRQVARNDIVKRVDDLKGRIRDWEKDARTTPADLAAQRARLAALENERDAVPQPDYSARWFAASILELAPEIVGDKAIAASMDDVDRRVNEHNRDMLKDRLPKPVVAGSAGYVGSESCKSCHAAAYEWWRGTKHGHAYATLEAVNKQFSLACVGCHVTGYNQPGGSTVAHVDNLKDVGCENCHGPSSLHNAEPSKVGLVQRDTKEATCKGCHNQEHSARFQYDAFHALLIAPGHGMPAPNAADKK